MNFLGMGPMELMLILVLALIIFGPGKLPEVAGQVGKTVRDIRRATTDLSSEFNRTLSLEIEEQKATEAAPAAAQPSTSTALATAPAAEAVQPATVPVSTTTSTTSPVTAVQEPALVGAGVTTTPVAPAPDSPSAPGSSWHWEEPWQPDAAPASAAVAGRSDDLAANPYMLVSATSDGAPPAAAGPVARSDPSELAPPY